MAVHHVEPVGLDEVDDDPLCADQPGDMGENPRIEGLGDLNPPAQALDRDPLPRGEELGQLVDLVTTFGGRDHRLLSANIALRLRIAAVTRLTMSRGLKGLTM